MKQILLILVCLAILQPAYCYLRHNLALQQHFATEQQKQAYFDELLKIQNNLSNQIDSLKHNTDNFNTDVIKSQKMPAVQTQMYENAIKQQRNKIFYIQSKLSLPFNNKTWDCQNLTKEEARATYNQILQTQKKIYILEESLKQQDCIVTDETKQQVEFLKLYINHLSKELGNLCQKPQFLKNFYLPFPNSNYTYGNDGEPGFKNKINKALQAGLITTNCPQNTPYPNNGKCISCDQGKIYDLTQSQCIQCPSGSYFDHKNHNCSKSLLNTNPDATNYQGISPPFNGNAKSCPSDQPFFNGKSCVSCSIPSFFNFNTNSCETCENNLIFNPVTKLCGYKQYNSNPDGKSNACCGIISTNNNLTTCPQATPYFNGKQCINCQKPSYFNITSLTCSYCQEGQGYSIHQHKCIDQKYLSPVYNSTINQNNQNYIGVLPVIGKQYENIVNCSTTQPYSNGHACEVCKLPSYFNFDTKQCEICPKDKIFDVNLHKCILLITSKMNTNMAGINNFQGTIPVFNKALQTCPKQKPFFNGQHCVECQLPKYIDFKSNQCKTCKDNYNFDTFNRECIVGNPKYYTNLNAKNIYYNGDFKVVKDKIQDIKTKHPSATQCPLETPYFNFLTNLCQKCPSDKPLFDFKYNVCTQCPNGTEFNSDNHRCLTFGTVTPTIQRMLMNTA